MLARLRPPVGDGQASTSGTAGTLVNAPSANSGAFLIFFPWRADSIVRSWTRCSGAVGSACPRKLPPVGGQVQDESEPAHRADADSAGHGIGEIVPSQADNAVGDHAAQHERRTGQQQRGALVLAVCRGVSSSTATVVVSANMVAVCPPG